MPHRQGDLNVLKDITATATATEKVGENLKLMNEVKVQSEKIMMTNGKGIKGQPGDEVHLAPDVPATTNGHSTSAPISTTNGNQFYGNGLVQHEQTYGSRGNGYNGLDNNGHAPGYSGQDNIENSHMGYYQNGYLGLPINGNHRDHFPSPPTKVNSNFLSNDPAIMTKLSEFTSYTNGLSKHNFDESEVELPKKIYRVVLTGGPCGGKTTGQARLCTFFENLGWKVFRVPEAATVLLSGGIKFSELSSDQDRKPFQTLFQSTENSYHNYNLVTLDLRPLGIGLVPWMDQNGGNLTLNLNFSKRNRRSHDLQKQRSDFIRTLGDKVGIFSLKFASNERCFQIDKAIRFQEELIKTMMQLEFVYFRLAETMNRDVLIICDRGTMDASAFIQRSDWEKIVERNSWNDIDLRDSRYNQIIHMVSAANGAEPFYTIEDHVCRSEGLELARDLDQKAAQAWVGHPYFDVVDNSTDFETKLCRMIQCVCQKLGIDTKDRLQTNSRKMKFLVQGPLPPMEKFPEGFQDFNVVHDYLQTSTPKMQARLRKRGQKSHWSYTYTVRRPELQGQVVEVKTTLTPRDYCNMLSQKENNHMTVYKTRRCFLLNDQYFQLDIYTDPCHPRCKGLILLETYTSLTSDELQQRLPKFLTIIREVSGDPTYSMFNLSLKDGWENNIHFCQSLTGSASTESMAEILSTESNLTGC